MKLDSFKGLEGHFHTPQAQRKAKVLFRDIRVLRKLAIFVERFNGEVSKKHLDAIVTAENTLGILTENNPELKRFRTSL
jgi:hypothetical protein